MALLEITRDKQGKFDQIASARTTWLQLIGKANEDFPGPRPEIFYTPLVLQETIHKCAVILYQWYREPPARQQGGDEEALSYQDRVFSFLSCIEEQATQKGISKTEKRLPHAFLELVHERLESVFENLFQSMRFQPDDCVLLRNRDYSRLKKLIGLKVMECNDCFVVNTAIHHEAHYLLAFDQEITKARAKLLDIDAELARKFPEVRP